MKRKFKIIITAMVGFAGVGFGQEAWTLKNPSPTAEDLSGVTYGNGMYIAVGANGTIVSSSNGAIWTNQTSGTFEHLYGVASNSSLFCAVSDSGHVFKSANAQNWNVCASISSSLYCVFYQSNLFIAGGGFPKDTCLAKVQMCMEGMCGWSCSFEHRYLAGTVLTSQDGTNWVSPQTNSSPAIRSICSNGNLYAGVGLIESVWSGEENEVSNFGAILTSQDGITWTYGTIGTYSNPCYPSSCKFLYGITYGRNLFCAVGAAGSIFTSPDGITWTGRASDTTRDLQAVAYGNGTFVAVGNYGTILSSADGMNWKIINSGTVQTLSGIACANNLFVAVGANGTILTSPFSTNAISLNSPDLHALRNDVELYGNFARYSLSGSSPVSLKLFDMRGGIVAMLFNGTQNAGEYPVAMPSNCPSGMYVLSLKAGNIKTDKTVLIRR